MMSLLCCLLVVYVYGFTPEIPDGDVIPVHEVSFDYYHVDIILDDPTLNKLSSWDITKIPDYVLRPNNDLSNADDYPETRFDLGWDFEFYGHKINWY